MCGPQCASKTCLILGCELQDESKWWKDRADLCLAADPATRATVSILMR